GLVGRRARRVQLVVVALLNGAQRLFFVRVDFPQAFLVRLFFLLQFFFFLLLRQIRRQRVTRADGDGNRRVRSGDDAPQVALMFLFLLLASNVGVAPGFVRRVETGNLGLGFLVGQPFADLHNPLVTGRFDARHIFRQRVVQLLQFVAVLAGG